MGPDPGGAGGGDSPTPRGAWTPPTPHPNPGPGLRAVPSLCRDPHIAAGGCPAHPPPTGFGTSPARGGRGEKLNPTALSGWFWFFFSHVYLISKNYLKLKYIKQWQLALLKLK